MMKNEIKAWIPRNIKPPELREAFRQLVTSQTITITKAAKKLGIARSTAFKWRDQLNLPKRAWVKQ